MSAFRTALVTALFLIGFYSPYSAHAESSRAFRSGEHRFSLRHQGLERWYIVYVPSLYSPQKPSALVLNFHGGGASPNDAIKQTRMNEASDRHGFLIAYPAGTGKTVLGRLHGTWNAQRCCGYAQDNHVDDVGFTLRMLEDMKWRFRIDPKRIYATGMSNGALFSYRLACELSEHIAAIAPVGAQDSLTECKPKRPVPVLHFHGMQDQSAPYAGGKCGGKLNARGWECASVPHYMEEWRLRNGCSAKTQEIYSRNFATCAEFLGCRQGATVALCTLADGGHTWPGGDYSVKARWWRRAVGTINRDIDANDFMWAFFEKHPLP